MAKKQTDLINSVKNNEIKDRIDNLINEIQRHRDLYYNKSPEISDAKYDLLEDELRELDPNNPIFSIVGKDSSHLYNKVEHILPMGSQDKVSTPVDFMKWVKKRNLSKYIIQFKLDGVSIEIQYDNGYFKRAVSRGDGRIGDDVSSNVKKMKGFLPKLESRFTGAVRAEVLLFHDVFEDIYLDKQNCRNAAAGIVRRKDGKGSEDLNLIFYDIVSLASNVKFVSELEKIKWLKNEGFPTVKTKTTKSPQEVIAVREDIMYSVRETLNYDIDGLVIKSNEIDLEDLERARPMKQIAFKFQAEEIETILLEVEWSVSGPNYTPVAIVKTVKLMGTNVSRASLANPNLIKELNLRIGSEVIISKRGDIIPKIERVIKTPADSKVISIPQICEVCNTKLINEGTRLFCPNENCQKREYQTLKKWLMKLEIKNFSEKLMLRKLFDTGKVRKIPDLYNLQVSDLTKFEGVKEVSANKALNNLFSIKDVSLSRFIAGFNIENIAEKIVSRVVNAGYDSLEKIKNASLTDLVSIEGFAEISAQTLIKGFQRKYPVMVQLLKMNKIKITEKIISKKLKGLSFCFTGKLINMKRAEAEQIVIENGGEPKKSVVNNLSYLVTNETTPTAKFKKAQEQSTKIITEAEFLKMIE